jgi:fructosamine-3-kinase
VSTERHGVSFWANTGRIDVELADGAPHTYFIKVESQDVGRDMLSSEHESMKVIHSVTPGFVPEPIAWGQYESIPDTYFLLTEFRDMRSDMPDPDKFTVRLSALHQNSESPEGKFGFHVKTHAGNLPQYTDWEDSWEVFFAKSMRQALDFEIEAKGYDPEFDELIPTLFNTVIPRLLRPLENDGRRVKPSLVHGDLWFANSGIDADTDEPLIFDACCFYAHNECGSWRGYHVHVLL